MPAEALVGSPLKKARPSVDITNTGEKFGTTQSLSAALDAAVSGASTPATTSTTAAAPPAKVVEEEEL